MKNKFLCIIVMIVTVCSLLSQPSWDGSLDFDSIEHRLVHDSIVQTQQIRHYFKKNKKKAKASTPSMLFVILQGDLKAVFKPGHHHYSEVAAFKATRALGQRLVPPTVMRTINGVHGSLQFLVESSIDLRNSDEHVLEKVGQKDISDMNIFYFVFGQWDTHRGNQIINYHNGKYYVALIDNMGIGTRSHNRYEGYPFLELGTNNKVYAQCTATFPYNEIRTLNPKSYEELRVIFGSYISESYMRQIWSRHKPITYCIWCDTLWMQMHRHNSSIKLAMTGLYYASTLKAYERLDRQVLEIIWEPWLAQRNNHVEQLISLTLERRDQMLKAAYSSGNIINDL